MSSRYFRFSLCYIGFLALTACSVTPEGRAPSADSTGEPTLSIADDTVVEGSNGDLVVTLSAVSDQDVTFDWTTSDGTATQPADYTAQSGSVTITAGQVSVTLPSIVTAADLSTEANEFLTVTLSNLTVASATGSDLVAALTLTSVDTAPVASAITPAAFGEDLQSVITLSYTDANLDDATACTISGLSNVTVTQACACAAGVCTVGVTGTSNYNGAASFNYTVTANGAVSNSVAATLTINAANDAPVANAITPAAFNQDAQSVITLSYTDVETDLATACTLSSLTNVTVTQACACAAGVCTVGVTGTASYVGSASFAYTVTAAGQTSAATATATLTINDVVPTVVSVTAPANATYYTAQNLDFVATFSENITVTGTPRINLTIGSTTRYATYQSGTGTTAITFRYTLVQGDIDTDGIANTSPMELNGGTLRDGSANNAPLIYTEPVTTSVFANKVTVVPIYTTTGDGTKAVWNDYVTRNGTANPYTLTDTACLGTETKNYYLACVHSGEKLKVVAGNQSSCSGLAISDSLGVFNWTCDGTTNPVRFYTVGLKEAKGLRDLIDFTGIDWKTNTVTITKSGSSELSSASSKWHSNTVSALPASTASTQTLATAGRVYILAATENASYGFNINADKIAVVFKAGTKITDIGSAPLNTAAATGETGADTSVFLAAGSQKYLWIEANTGQSASARAYTGIYFKSVSYSVIRNSNLAAGTQFTTGIGGIVLSSSTSNLITGSQVIDTQGGMQLTSASNYNVITGMTIGGNFTTNGLNISASSYNIFQKIVSNANFNFSNTTRGITLSSTATNNVMTNILSAGNGSTGILNTGQKNTLGLLTIASNYNSGLIYNNAGAGDNTTFSLAMINNGYGTTATAAISTTNSTSNNFADLAIAHNSGVAIAVNTAASAHTFSGLLLYGNNTSANCTGGAGYGILSTCLADGASTHTVASSALDLSSTFKEKITSDTTNTYENASGQATANWDYGDFFNFDNWMRVWLTSSVAAYPNSPFSSECYFQGASACQIFDFRLSSSDTALLNKSHDGSSANNNPNTADAWASAVTSCPAAVGGNVTMTDEAVSASTFLRKAVEIIGDGIGDEDGLCESSEACIYQPNFGAYMGEGTIKFGNYDSTCDSGESCCTFSNGTVTGVTMYGYPTNGA